MRFDLVKKITFICNRISFLYEYIILQFTSQTPAFSQRKISFLKINGRKFFFFMESQA